MIAIHSASEGAGEALLGANQPLRDCQRRLVLLLKACSVAFTAPRLLTRREARDALLPRLNSS